MQLEHRVGDLLAADLPAIAHGCNCRGVMGSGIAKAIAAKYPGLLPAYRNQCTLGEFVLGSCFMYREAQQAVFNLGTQLEPGPDARLSAIYDSVTKMFSFMEDVAMEWVGIPRIGAGIGGLRWEHVEGVLLAAGDEFPAINVLVFTLPSDVAKFA